tara:strand:+ start:206 stop:646 length:441 start_codon:yes stop_codon:yes gene_type:complete
MNQHTLTRILTYSGALPIIFFVLVKLFGRADLLFINPERGLVLYSAVILSFLGGINFGFAIAEDLSKKLTSYLLISSILTAIFAFVILVVPGFEQALTLLIFGFAIQFVNDYFIKQDEIIEEWFMNLRFWATIVVLLFLLVASYQI